MSNPTTPFSWQMPTAVDLVTDLPADFEVFGQAVATSMQDLLGGTTGQILSKASNTDMDFTWITNDVGDITAVTAGTGITGGGTSGAVTVSFDQTNFGGGQYAAGKNKIINGDFRVNQRSFTSTTTSATYGFDRWRNTSSGGTVTYSAQTFTPGTAPASPYEAINYARLVTASQSASSDRGVLNQLIEDVRTLSGTTATVSFFAQAGSGTPKINVVLNQNFGTSGSASVNAPIPTAQTITTSWVRYSFTIAIPSVSGKTITSDSRLNLQIYVSDGGDQSTGVGAQNNTFNFWGVQIESGSTATPFQTATGTIAGELAACQRYYYRVTPGTSGSRFSALIGATSGTDSYGTINNPVPMRTTPTSVDFSALNVVNAGTSTFAVTSITNNPTLGTINNAGISVFVASGLTVGSFHSIQTSSASGYIGFSAEL